MRVYYDQDADIGLIKSKKSSSLVMAHKAMLMLLT